MSNDVSIRRPYLFINYRTKDTGASAALLHRELSARLARGQIFIDHEHIEGGGKLPERIQEALERATVMFALIGKDWKDAKHESGKRRLDLEDDWVRIEIASHLARGLPLVPVIVDSAPQPAKDWELPSDLEGLKALRYLPFQHIQSEADAKALIKVLVSNHRFKRRWHRLLSTVRWLAALALFIAAAMAVYQGLRPLPAARLDWTPLPYGQSATPQLVQLCERFRADAAIPIEPWSAIKDRPFRAHYAVTTPGSRLPSRLDVQPDDLAAEFVLVRYDEGLSLVDAVDSRRGPVLRLSPLAGDDTIYWVLLVYAHSGDVGARRAAEHPREHLISNYKD